MNTKYLWNPPASLKEPETQRLAAESGWKVQTVEGVKHHLQKPNPKNSFANVQNSSMDCEDCLVEGIMANMG